MRQHLRLYVEPHRNQPSQQLIQHHGHQAAEQRTQQTLTDHLFHPLRILSPYGVGNLDGVTNPHALQNALDQPQRGRGGRHSGRALGTQNTHHSHVHIADHGGQQLFQDGGNGQTGHHLEPGHILNMGHGPHTPVKSNEGT